MERLNRKQVVIVGGGIAGLLAALELRRQGVEPVILEARAKEDWRDYWMAEVDSEAVLNQRIPPPRGACVEADAVMSGDFLPPSGRQACHVAPLPIVPVRMWDYQRQLLDDWAALGGEMRFSARVADLERSQRGRGVRVLLEQDPGEPTEVLETSLVVLAVGSAVLAWGKVLQERFGFPMNASLRDFLQAAYQRWDVGPEASTGAFMGSPAGTNQYRMGLFGPFSTCGMGLHPSGRTVSLLVGTVPSDGAPPATEVLRKWPRDRSGFAKLRGEGGGWIPIRRPLPVLAHGGIAVIGGAACQSFPLTACGVGLTGTAATLLSNAAREVLVLGRGDAALWQYSVEYHRRFGGLQAFAQCLVEAIRSSGPGSEWVEALFTTGLMESGDFLRGLSVSPLDVSLSEIPTKVMALVRHPKNIALAAAAARGFALLHAYGTLFPERPNLWSVERFSRLTRQLIREAETTGPQTR